MTDFVASFVLHQQPELIRMAGEMHDVGSVVVQSVDQVGDRGRRCVLNLDEIAVFRAAQALPDLADLLVYAKPGPVLVDPCRRDR